MLLSYYCAIDMSINLKFQRRDLYATLRCSGGMGVVWKDVLTPYSKEGKMGYHLGDGFENHTEEKNPLL